MTAQRTIPLQAGQGELKASQGTPAPASVLAIAEMNLEEYPAFRLGRRSKRLELRYSRTRTDAEGHTLEQTWIVRGVEGLGLPGPFEQDLYVALLVLFTEQGLPADGRIRFTRNRLAQVMGCSNSGRGYELLEQGLSRLAGATVHTEHAFYRPGAISPKGERSGPAERLSLDFHILEEVRVYERRTFVEADTTPLTTGDAGAQPLVERGRPLEVSVARLGQPLVQSYERRYTKGLDATFYFGLERPLAKRLYRYLDKVRNGRGGFEIGLLALADVLGLEYRYPSDVKDGLSDAHAELQATGYLAGAGYAPLAGGPKAGEKVVYGIQPAFDKRPRRRAGSVEPAPGALGALGTLGEVLPRRNGSHSREQRALPDASVETSLGQAPALPAPAPEAVTPPAKAPPAEAPPAEAPPAKAPRQLELESLGVSPARAASLVAAHPDETIAAHIAYVRRRQEGRSGEVPLKNPAGFLARAIEEGYSLPPAVPVSASPPAPSAPLPLTSETGPAEAPEIGSGQAPDQAPAPGSPGPASQTSATPMDVPAAGPADAEPADDTPWGRLMAGLRERVSPATFAAWVRPAVPASGAETEAGGATGAEPGAPAALTVVLPSAFALDRWRRPPIATALQQASVAAGITVVLDLQPAAGQEA